MSCPEGLDRIDVTGVSGFGRHGALAAERELGQRFSADVSLGLDLEDAGRSGELARSVDYGELAHLLHEVIESEPVDLIESLCLRMVDLCWEYARVQWVSVTVHKPEAPIAVTYSDVAVTVERRRT